MRIHVEPGDWKSNEDHVVPSTENIRILLANVSEHLLCHLITKPSGRIRVKAADEPHPSIDFTKSSEGEYVIRLTARGPKWDQFIFQFSHEFCHLLCGHERLERDQTNRWIHEVFCETASLFTLRKMSDTWTTRPPNGYPEFYALALNNYAKEIISRDVHQIPPGELFGNWFINMEQALRSDPQLKNLNRNHTIIATQLLPLLEASPSNWEAIRYLPDTDKHFQEFLALWLESCPSSCQDFVRQVAEVFRIDASLR